MARAFALPNIVLQQSEFCEENAIEQQFDGVAWISRERLHRQRHLHRYLFFSSPSSYPFVVHAWLKPFYRHPSSLHIDFFSFAN